MKITVIVKGLVELQRKLDRYHSARLNRALGKASIAAARTLVRPMRAAAPKRTGKLAKSIKATRAKRQDKPGAIVGPRIWYRHFPIKGTKRGVPSNPFVTRTAEANAGNTARKFRDVLHDELAKR